MITEELSAGIKDWIAKKPDRRNLSLLARLSNVSYATVRRIASNEGEPSCDVAACICDIIFPREKTVEILEKYFPRFAKVMNGLNYTHATDDTTREYFSSKEHFPAIIFATTKSGTTYEEIEAKLGERGKDALSDLVEAGIVIEIDGRYILKEDVSAPFNRPLARDQLRILLDHCRRKTDSIAGASGAQVMVEGLNKEGIDTLNDLIEEFLRSMVAILTQEKYKGDILWFGAWAHNVLKGEEYLQ